MNRRKRVLALLMSTILACSLAGVPAFADEQPKKDFKEPSAAPALVDEASGPGAGSGAQVGEGQAVPATPPAAATPDAQRDEAAPAEGASEGEGFKGNSWRYRDGEPMQDEGSSGFAPFQFFRSATPPWSLGPNGYVSSDGSIIKGAKRKGIDVSEHQGYIDWDAVKNDGIDFAIIRCGYGSDHYKQDDKQWARNVSECERLGIPYGVYLYSYAANVDMARSEARHVLRLLKGHSPVYPVYYDLEEKSLESTANRGLLAQMASAFCGDVRRGGYEPGVYANKNWWDNYLTDPVFGSWPRWVAQWNPRPTYAGKFNIWQAADDGSVAGIGGAVDINFDFVSSVEGWRLIGGRWYYLNADFSRVTGWKLVGGTWYYFDGSGAMQTGWLKLGSTWYYLNPSGAMQTGWVNTGGTWYYLSASGAMQTGWITLGATKYYLDPGSGAMHAGWLKLKDSWYYFGASGAMATGWLKLGPTWYWLDPASGVMSTGWALTPGGTWYYFDGSGAMLSNRWLNLNSTWYYLGASGAMASGWLALHGTWYWLDPASGAMATGLVKTPDGRRYYLDGSGAMLANRWLKLKDDWYYLGASGAMASGWLKLGPTWYYLDPASNAMATGWLALGSTWYYLEPGSGAMATGWLKTPDNTWYYCYDTGAMAANVWTGNYYVGASGAMAVNTWIGPYYVGADGAWIPGYVQGSAKKG